jgi:transposase
MDRLEKLREKPFEIAVWQKLFYQNQKSRIRKRLEAVKYLYEGMTRKEVMIEVRCARQTLVTWIDMYCAGGLESLTKATVSNKPERLSDAQKVELKRMLLENKPTDYGIERQIWSGKIIVEVIKQRWDVDLRDSRIYAILKELGLSHQKAHRDYENADPLVQQEFVSSLKKKIEGLKDKERIVFYDEFAVYDRPSLYYAWAERNHKPEVPSNEKRKRNKVNGMLSVNAVSGEIYLQLKEKSKAEDVAAYLADLASDAHLDQIQKLLIVLDNNSTHKQKMINLLIKEIDNRGLSKKITLEFMYTPAYSPDFNLAEYEIHLLRLQELHHLPSDTTIPKITDKLKGVNILMNPSQISNTLEHIYSLAPLPNV